MATEIVTAVFAGIAAAATIAIAASAFFQIRGLREESARAETSRQRQLERQDAQIQQMERARRDAARPLMVALVQQVSTNGELFIYVGNIGTGPALSVAIQGWLLPLDAMPEISGTGIVTGQSEALSSSRSMPNHFYQHYQSVAVGKPVGVTVTPQPLISTGTLPTGWRGKAGVWVVFGYVYKDVFGTDFEEREARAVASGAIIDRTSPQIVAPDQ